MVSPGYTGIRELSPGMLAAAWGMAICCSSGMPLSMPSSSVMIFVVLAGFMRSRSFLPKSTSPEVASISTAAWE